MSHRLVALIVGAFLSLPAAAGETGERLLGEEALTDGLGMQYGVSVDTGVVAVSMYDHLEVVDLEAGTVAVSMTDHLEIVDLDAGTEDEVGYVSMYDHASADEVGYVSMYDHRIGELSLMDGVLRVEVAPTVVGIAPGAGGVGVDLTDQDGT